MSISISNNGDPRIGVFVCRCGGKIDGPIDAQAVAGLVQQDDYAAHVETLPYTCMAPGLAAVRRAVAEKGLDRVIVAGCESRIMLKKFEKELIDQGLEKGQIDMVNLRDHVARSNDGEPEDLAAKAAKLIAASAAGLTALIPSPKIKVDFEGPVMIVGGGIATYSAAQELLRSGIESILAVLTDDPEDEIRMIHETYPGERHYHDRLMAVMDEVNQSPLVRKVTVGQLRSVTGRTGQYTVTFDSLDDKPPLVFDCGAIIAALDGQMLNQGSDFGHDGVRVVCQTEMEEYLWMHGPPQGELVFWINDLETPGRPWAHLASRSAWNMARHIRNHSRLTGITIMYNQKMELPLSAAERVQARQQNIKWVPYHESYRPTIQSGYITYTRPEDHIEEELPWTMMCLSPLRSPGHESLKTAEILGLDVADGAFLERNPQMVRPEQVGQDKKFVAGSARYPCDLQDALRQGRRAAKEIAELVLQANRGELYAPRMVCSVDEAKCVGCGLCNEICDCGGFEAFEGKGGNVPRRVDPMVCTGGGTCAAACPYLALTLQNNTTDMRLARVTALARKLSAGEAMGFGCGWGGGAAADHAGIEGLQYDRRFHMLPVSCIGQLDPAIMSRAIMEGANGLLLLGCPPEECHHSYGLDHAWSRVNLVKKLLDHVGVDRRRVVLAHVDINHPEQFVNAVNRFMEQMDELGPIDRTDDLKAKLTAMHDTLLNPRVRWVLGAGLRRPYEKHYPADQRNALAYDETVLDVLAEEYLRARVLQLLRESKQTMQLKDIADHLAVDGNRVSRTLADLAGEGAISRIYKDRTPFYVLQ
jgi:heterodisulfide reductase subunit A-like polyferredoxin